jgi:cytochrome c oxidase assembly protein subunit 15
MPFEPRVIAWVHADAVWLFVGLIIASYALIRFGQVSLKTRTSLNWLTTVVLLQGLIGYAQYFNGLPALLVALHVLGATLVWVATLVTARHIRYSD